MTQDIVNAVNFRQELKESMDENHKLQQQFQLQTHRLSQLSDLEIKTLKECAQEHAKKKATMEAIRSGGMGPGMYEICVVCGVRSLSNAI